MAGLPYSTASSPSLFWTHLSVAAVVIPLHTPHNHPYNNGASSEEWGWRRWSARPTSTFCCLPWCLTSTTATTDPVWSCCLLFWDRHLASFFGSIWHDHQHDLDRTPTLSPTTAWTPTSTERQPSLTSG